MTAEQWPRIVAEPIVDDFCGHPLYHGERDVQPPGFTEVCFCGAEHYWACPGWLNGGGIGGWTIGTDNDGRLTVTPPEAVT